MSRVLAQDLTVANGDHVIRVRVDGRSDGPVVLLSNALASTLDMWAPQLEAFARRFKVVRYDSRGHGGSTVHDNATLAQMGGDALAVLDAVGAERANVVGLSLGGQVALWLAIEHPQRVGRIVVANSGAAISAPDIWDGRIAAVRQDGMQAVAAASVERWFTPAFRAAQPAVCEAVLNRVLAVDPRGYMAGCLALRGADLRYGLAAITAPALLIGGTHDAGTPPAAALEIQAAIPGARYVELNTSHLSNQEDPDGFNRAVLEFLLKPGALTEADRFAVGESLRRQVLGDAWVDAALGKATAFTEDFQNVITRYAWGEVWSRPGLRPYTRSCITLSICIALGRWEEFRLHIGGALNNGHDANSLKELILQSAIYAGVPAANTASHHAAEVLAGLDAL